LWAALSSAGAGPTKVYTKQVILALTWLRAFFNLEAGYLTRVVRADAPATIPVVAFDASPFGMGAVLWVVPATARITIESLAAIRPFACMHLQWSAQHEILATAKVGDPGSQARWEALAMLLAFRSWDSVIAKSSGMPIAFGDALGMLYGAARFRSKDPVLNKIFMEMALLFAPRGSTLEAVHIWSEENHIADALSRMGSEVHALPPCLDKVPRTKVCDGEFKILGQN